VHTKKRQRYYDTSASAFQCYYISVGAIRASVIRVNRTRSNNSIRNRHLWCHAGVCYAYTRKIFKHLDPVIFCIKIDKYDGVGSAIQILVRVHKKYTQETENYRCVSIVCVSDGCYPVRVLLPRRHFSLQ